MVHFERIKEELSDQERKAYNHEKAFIDSCEIAINLLEKIYKSHHEINFGKTMKLIVELKRRVVNLGKDRSATTIVGTAIYLAHDQINRNQVSKIMENFGKCTRAAITQLCEFLKIRKKDLYIEYNSPN